MMAAQTSLTEGQTSLRFGQTSISSRAPGGGASFGFAFLRMVAVEGGSAIIVRAATTEGGAMQRLQIKDR